MALGDLWLLPVGVFVGVYGTVIGAGGGFLLVPLLMALFPSYSPSLITAASLSIVCANALSGTAAYARMRRISYRSGWVLALATVPGAVAGSYVTGFIPRRLFSWIFGALLIAVAVFLSVTRAARARDGGAAAGRPPGKAAGGPRITDTVRTRDGATYTVSFNLWLGVGLSFAVGLFSSLVGIGGGLIHVPVLTYLFGFPIHVATATSHLVLVITALAGVLTHVADGTFPRELPRLILLAAGVIGGAQLGAPLSRRISGPWIVVGLAVALGAVGVRLILTAL